MLVILSILLFISLVAVAVLTYYVVSNKNCPVPPKLSKQVSNLLSRINYTKDMNFDCFDCYIDVFTSDDMINYINNYSQKSQNTIIEALIACYENAKCNPDKNIVSILESKTGIACRDAFITYVMDSIPNILGMLQTSKDPKADIESLLGQLMQKAGCIPILPK
jgi:hypothetical protein